MIRVLSVKVRGHRRNTDGTQIYSAIWVDRLHAMIRRNLTADCRHYCLTDDPAGIAGWIQPIDISGWWAGVEPAKGWWAKVKLFDQALPFNAGDRLIFSDLDALIIRPIDGMLAETAHFPLVFAPHTAPNFRPPGTVNLYSSCFMAWDFGHAARLFEEWTPQIMARLRGDQDWFGATMPREAVFAQRYFERVSGCMNKGPRRDTLIVQCAKPKNHIAAGMAPWVAAAWMGT